MSLLEKAETDESISAILSLLGMGMKTVPKNVLKKYFGKATECLMEILKKYAAEENFLILRHVNHFSFLSAPLNYFNTFFTNKIFKNYFQCIGCLSILLRIQESAAWINETNIHQVLYAILAFTVHSKPKLRKAAQHAVCSLLKGILTNYKFHYLLNCSVLHLEPNYFL